MAQYKVFKETALPGTLDPHSVYLVAPAAHPGYLEIYVTNAAGDATRRVPTIPNIQAMIDVSLAGATGGASIVDDIAARDALTPDDGEQAYVIDASADGTVSSGGATYIYRLSTTTWIKQSEAESLDLALTWASITGKPTSTPAQIDAAVTASHSHTNKTELDKIGESAGRLQYDGAFPTIDWDSTGW